MIHTGDQELELFLWDHWYHGRWNQGLQGHVRLCSQKVILTRAWDERSPG